MTSSVEVIDDRHPHPQPLPPPPPPPLHPMQASPFLMQANEYAPSPLPLGKRNQPINALGPCKWLRIVCTMYVVFSEAFPGFWEQGIMLSSFQGTLQNILGNREQN